MSQNLSPAAVVIGALRFKHSMKSAQLQSKIEHITSKSIYFLLRHYTVPVSASRHNPHMQPWTRFSYSASIIIHVLANPGTLSLYQADSLVRTHINEYDNKTPVYQTLVLAKNYSSFERAVDYSGVSTLSLEEVDMTVQSFHAYVYQLGRIRSTRPDV